MGRYTLKQLKKLSFEEIKKLFETIMKIVNTFVPMETKVRGRASELAARSSQATITDSAEVGSSKRTAEAKFDYEGSKRQKTNEASWLVQEQPDEEENELSQEDLQQMMMVVPVEEVYVEALQSFVKERFSSTEPTDDKERTLWVELKRLFEPNINGTLWKLQRESVGNKMHKAFSLPGIEFPLAEEVLTASEEGCHCQKKRDATTRKIALLSKLRRNCQSKSNDSFTKDSYEVPISTASTTTTDTPSGETGNKSGRTVTLTVEDMQKKKNDVKARTTLLLSLPDEHQLRFTEGSETLEQTFNRLQVIVGQLQFMDVEIKQDDLNQKFLTSLALEWLMHTIVWRNKIDLDTMSLDDLYNHIKDINQIDEDDIEEMDIKWNMALLSMRADKFWKKTGKKINIQGSDVAGFDKSKVKCFNCHKIGHFVRECRAPRSQDRGRRDNYRKGSKAKEQAPKALMAIDGVRWDWSYMANDEEDHALVADEVAPTEFALMANTSAESKVFDNSLCLKDCKKNNDSLNCKITYLTDKLFDAKNLIYHYKLGLAQVESRLIEYKEREVKYCEKIRTLEFRTESNNECIEILKKKLETLKIEKDRVDEKLAGLLTASKDLDNLIESQRADKNKEGLGYMRSHYRAPWIPTVNRNFPPVNRKFSTGSRNFPTANRKFPTVSRKFSAGSTKCSTADMGMKRKACMSPKDTLRNVPVETQSRNVSVETSTSNALVSQCLESVEARFLVYQQNETIFEEDIKLLKLDVELRDNALVALRKKYEKAKQERDELKHKLEKFQTSSKFQSQLLASQTNDKTRLGYENQVFTSSMFNYDEMFSFESDVSMPASHVYYRYQSGEGYHVVPPLYTGTFMSPKSDLVFRDAPTINETVHTDFNVDLSSTKPDKDLSHSHRPSAPIIEDWVSDSKDESEAEPSQNDPSFVQPTKQVKSPRHFVKPAEHPIPANNLKTDSLKSRGQSNSRNKKACFVLLTRSKLVPFTAARPVTTAVPYHNVTRPRPAKTVVTKPHSPPRRTINRSSSPKPSNFPHKVTTVKAPKFYGKKRIKREFSVARILQQNEIVERKNRTLIEAARTMLADSLLPIPFWAEAVNTACYVHNRVLVTKPHNKTPYELLLGRTPSIGFMRPFCCHVTILNTLDPLGKFDGKADEGFLVGYSVSRSGPTWLFDIDTLTKSMNYQPVTAGNRPNPSAVVPRQISMMTRLREAKGKSHVELSTGFRNLSEKFEYFFDNKINEVNAASNPVFAVGQITTNNTNTFSATSPSNIAVSPTLRESSYVDPSQYPDDPNMPALEDITYSDDEDDVGAEADFSNLETIITVSHIPTTRVHRDHPVTQIIGDLSLATQTRSMTRMVKEQEPKRVHQALKDQSWIEAIQEELLQFKMQKVWVLVDLPNGKRVIGHTQEEGIDYEEVFAPVARIEAITLFLAYASFMGFMVYQMDVKSAFLYETIEEEVYVCQPPGFEDPDYPDKVYKVVKALYGLHQAFRAWFETLDNYLLKNGSQRGKIDQTLFINKQKGDILLVQVYVDVIIFGSTNKDLCKGFEKLMKDKFQMSLIAEILRKFSLTDGKSAITPIDTEKPLLKDPDREDVDQTVIATSSTEVEYVAAASCYAQVLWIQNQLLDYGVKVTTVGVQLNTAGCYYASEGFDQILDFLNASSIRKKVIITEDTVRQGLRLDGSKSIDCLPNEEIFTELAKMGYEKPSTKLTFYKQADDDVKDVVADDIAADDVPAADIEPTPPLPTPATTPPPLQDIPSTSQVAPTPPLSPHQSQQQQPSSPQQQQPSHDATISMDLLYTLLETCATLTRKVEALEQDKVARAFEITKLKQRVRKLERKNKLKVFGLRRLKKVGTAQRIESSAYIVMVSMTKVIKGEFETLETLNIYDVLLTGDDEVEHTDEDFDDEGEVAGIFMIETNVFDFETPLCRTFKEFNYLLQIDPDVLSKDIGGFKTYKEYKDGWIYEWNKDVPWVHKKHRLTLDWRKYRYCNGGNLPGAYIVGNTLRYQDLEWYEALEDGELKEEVLRNKAIMEGTIDDDDEFKMIKYSFRDDEEYVAVKEDEYDDLTSTSKDACRAYQEIFRMMDEGWMDLAESNKNDEVREVSIIWNLIDSFGPRELSHRMDGRTHRSEATYYGPSYNHVVGLHLCIEGSLRVQDNDKPKGNNVVGPSAVNMVEHNNSSRYNDNRGTKGSVDGSSKSLKGQNMFNKSLQDEALDKFKLFKIEFELQQGSLIKRFKTDRGGERGIKCIFVGYAEYSKAFRFYVIEPNNSVAINSIIELWDAIFDEHRFSSVPRPSQKSLVKGTKDSGGLVVPEKVTEEARMVSHGFKQKSKIDYSDTYALVARISTIRLLIAMASIHSLIIHQMDVKTAFLNDELEEEVYMNQPQAFIMHANENKVYKLIKSLYEMKQTPKQWHQKFNEVVLSNGYLLNQAENVYIENLMNLVDLTKEFLSSMFSMKDMREADVILVSTPVDTSEKLIPNNGQAVSQLEYSRVNGCLMYAMTCTRPDIAFVMGKLSRYTSNPGTQHWQAIHMVLKYLKKTMDYRLLYIGYPSVLKGYTDASSISNTEDNSSTSGWVFLLGGGEIPWASKKQTCITGSTMKYEFMALAAASKEAEWLKNLLLKIPLWVKSIAPISIRFDSAATLAKDYSHMYNRKSRHLGVRHSMIRELIT
uniref:Zinc finger, CCHC-type n=1 Tax=Tanacetum cinerariifolium TaxID=118510 RepID=A0A6L2MQT8_TANCI|nr:zinc finger, CCHC-type [Tanacetum cinerariifolium]